MNGEFYKGWTIIEQRIIGDSSQFSRVVGYKARNLHGCLLARRTKRDLKIAIKDFLAQKAKP